MVYVAMRLLRTAMKPCSMKTAATNGCTATVPVFLCLTMSTSRFSLAISCSLCAQSKHSEAIEEMRATIAALREEIKELHVALERSVSASTSTDKCSTSEGTSEPKHEWTNIVRRTQQRLRTARTSDSNNRNRGSKKVVQQATNDS